MASIFMVIYMTFYVINMYNFGQIVLCIPYRLRNKTVLLSALYTSSLDRRLGAKGSYLTLVRVADRII